MYLADTIKSLPKCSSPLFYSKFLPEGVSTCLNMFLLVRTGMATHITEIMNKLSKSERRKCGVMMTLGVFVWGSKQ